MRISEVRLIVVFLFFICCYFIVDVFLYRPKMGDLVIVENILSNHADSCTAEIISTIDKSSWLSCGNTYSIKIISCLNGTFQYGEKSFSRECYLKKKTQNEQENNSN